MNGFHKTIAALAAIGAAGVLLCLILPLEDAWRAGAIGGVLVSIAGAIPAVMLHARAMAPATPDQAMNAMAVGVKAMAAAMVIRFGFCALGLFFAMKFGASGAAFATGFFGVYFTLQAAEARWLLVPQTTLRGDAT